MQIAPALSAGQTLRVRFWANGYGWNAVNAEFSIPVLAQTDDQAILLVGDGDMDDEGNVPIHGMVRVLVGAANGAELTAARLYAVDNWWSEEEVNHDYHPEWFDEKKANGLS